MRDLVDLLRCPSTGRPLSWAGGDLASEDGRVRFKLIDGVACTMPDEASVDADDPSRSVREFYASEGWEQDEQLVRLACELRECYEERLDELALVDEYNEMIDGRPERYPGP